MVLRMIRIILCGEWTVVSWETIRGSYASIEILQDFKGFMTFIINGNIW